MIKIIVDAIKDLIKYRSLAWDLAVKDIKVRYRSPVLGFLWAALVPLIMVIIFKVVFSSILKIGFIENYPFFIYLMTAVFPWTFFSSSLTGATESISSNSELIKKTYFPRHIIPFSVVLASLINFIPAIIVMFLILIFFKIHFTVLILFLPLILLFQTIFTIGLAFIVSSLQVVLRDIRYMLELFLMAWLYFSPAFYSLSMISNFSEIVFKFYIINPFVGFFCFYRVVFLNGFASTLPKTMNLYYLAAWLVTISLFIFITGILIFKKYEPYFSDLV